MNKSKIIFLVFFVIVLFSVSPGVFAWSNPTTIPPNGNGVINVISGAPVNTLYFASGGNVGIGKINPLTTLDVNGIVAATTFSGALSAGNVSSGTFGSNTGSGNYIFPASLSASSLSVTSDGGLLKLYGTGGASTHAYTEYYAGGSSAGRYAWVGYGSGGGQDFNIMNQRPTGNLYLGTNNTNQLTVISSGSVGIGTTTPGYRLDVNGSVNGTQICIAGVCQTAWPTGSLTGSGTTNYLPKWTGATTLGNSLIFDNGASVGIGNASPTYKLDVVSGGASTARIGTASTDTVLIGGGTGKITVGTVDPVYNIDGKKYATYMTGMTGVKEETVKTIYLVERNGFLEGAIDFANSKEGSDEWLFYQATDFGKDWRDLVVILSPGFNGKIWYQKDLDQKRVIIHGTSDNKAALYEVSYRLTAPRFDHGKWTNFSVDETEGLKVERKI